MDLTAQINFNGTEYSVDFKKPVDLSLPVKPSGVKAWYVSDPEIKPVEAEGFTGAVSRGGNVNFRNVFFNPHGHGTHTECVGHIAEEVHSVNRHIKEFIHPARLISIKPENINGDRIITKEQVAFLKNEPPLPALMVRTLPNSPDKKDMNYSNTNPAYIHHEAMKLIVECGVEHFLIDTPSVDREEDSGKLLSHRTFWGFPSNIRYNCSITELIFVPNDVADGIYLLNLQFASIENDASPSKPVIYELKNTKP